MYGIAGINFIPQRAEERLNLAKLAIGDHKDLQLQKFVHLHHNQHAQTDMVNDDHSVPLDVDSLSPTPDDTCKIQSFDKENEIDTEIELQDILRLHRQVSDDVELKLKND